MNRKHNYGRSAACWVCCVYVLGSGCVFESIGNGLSAGLTAVANCAVQNFVDERLDIPDAEFNQICSPEDMMMTGMMMPAG